MRVLQVIHGFPPRYNAGSEVYTRALSHALCKLSVETGVFCRQSSALLPSHTMSHEQDGDVRLFVVNHGLEGSSFVNRDIDAQFERVLDSFVPDVVHFGHLSHLSTNLVRLVKARPRVPIFFTLHDFWLMCPRGQFLHHALLPATEDPSVHPWPACDGQEDEKCARWCMNRFHADRGSDEDIRYWTWWVSERMNRTRQVAQMVDCFLAPSQWLLERHVREFGVDRAKIHYLDYGFDRKALSERSRSIPTSADDVVIGFTGRHHPSKGIDLLLRSVSRLKNRRVRLRVWGRPVAGVTESLMALAEAHGIAGRVEWFPEYANGKMVEEVLNKCDCLCVPSIWDENSPLVIHEAQQAQVPVITSKKGGMGEYVKDGENGFTFEHRDEDSLVQAIERALANIHHFERLGHRGYLNSSDGQVPDINNHAQEILDMYRKQILLKKA